jgi:hypothetical protein
VLESILVALQTFQVLFLALHDWIPMGRLNDVLAVRREIPFWNLSIATVIQTAFFAVGLFFSISFFGRTYPMWLNYWLWISYAMLFIGEIEAWWIPYLVKPYPKRAGRYQKMFGSTHSFLPEHNGIVPNTAHVLLHLATAATLLVLMLKHYQHNLTN